MGIKIRSCKIALVLSLLAGSMPAFAEVPALTPLNYEMRYNVAWNGLPIGRVRITAKQDGFGYSMVVDTKTRGMVDMFSGEHALAQVKGRVDESLGFIPQLYDSRSLSKKDGRTTTITYDGEGKIKERKRTPPDGDSRPVVALDEANTATDPITAFFVLREKMHGNIARNQRETVIRTYEGARLAEFTFKVISRARVEVGGEYVNAINVVPKRLPLNGYKEKELKKYRAGDPTVHLYMSADERFVPLQASVDLSFGEITAELVDITPIE